VKLRYDRDDDFMITGRRHGFEFDWEAGFDDAGRLLGVELTMIANAGFSTDLSPPVLTRAICHADNAGCLRCRFTGIWRGRTPSPTPLSAASADRRAPSRSRW
jgi:xanthine dehydrogenase molybdopterin-binding subunit B